jgi:dTDP-4-amino-4,6-dideoxygalactose transaminase
MPQETIAAVPLLDLQAQYATLKSEIMPAIEAVCDSQWVCLGPAVQAFEKEVAAYCGCAHAIAVSSGSDALLAALMALEIGPGDEVITTPFTFFATAGAVVRLGARPVFVDVDPVTMNIDAQAIAQAIGPRTKVILPVHLFGQMADMTAINSLAREHNLRVIEDAAQAIGSRQNDRSAGTVGDMGCFSFYPTKNLGAFGDAGLVTTGDADLAGQLRILRDHGQNPRYYYHRVGGNFRMDGIQGAVLGVKLKYVEQWNEKRRRNAALYDRLLQGGPVETPAITAGNVSVYHQYTLRAPRRDKLQAYLIEQNIGCAVFYPKPLHLQPCFADLGHREGDFPVSERLAAEVLSLPIYAELNDAQIEHVAQTVLRFYGTSA